MKAVTKAKRRAVISICGLGVIDELELDTVSDRVQPVQPTIQKPQPKRVEVKPPVIEEVEHSEDGASLYDASFSEPEHLADVPGVEPVALESGGDFVDQQDGFVTVTVKAIGPVKEDPKGAWTKWGFFFIDVATGEEIGWGNTFSETVATVCTNAKHTEAAIQVKLKESKYGHDILEAVGDDE